jgi:hypothetical protein
VQLSGKAFLTHVMFFLFARSLLLRSAAPHVRPLLKI